MAELRIVNAIKNGEVPWSVAERFTILISAFIFGVAVLSFLIIPLLPVPANAHGTHPGKAKRLKSCLSRGDIRMTRSVAGHTISYALARYQIKDQVTQAHINRAKGEMYNYLKTELGSPIRVCSKYIGLGYQHSDLEYGAKASEMLLSGPEVGGGTSGPWKQRPSLRDPFGTGKPGSKGPGKEKPQPKDRR